MTPSPLQREVLAAVRAAKGIPVSAKWIVARVQAGYLDPPDRYVDAPERMEVVEALWALLDGGLVEERPGYKWTARG